MTQDPLCKAKHLTTRLADDCRCNEYAKVRADERRRMRRIAELAYRKATPARQGRMTPEQKARVAAAHDFLILVTSEIQQ
jgi:hypothetical protein